MNLQRLVEKGHYDVSPTAVFIAIAEHPGIADSVRQEYFRSRIPAPHFPM